ncbi:Fe-S cluster assembly ATPase SufC, partial [Candidatus Gottesmanbacteria bacterium]|nr:Fe-S cluster assembly ATPase SufC [Candidatus Gottesmanbacteria bacterium]
YKIKNQKSKVKINEKNIIKLMPNERAKEGLFLAFQNPIAIPGVSVANFLKTAYQALNKPRTKNQPASPAGRELRTKFNPSLSVWEFNENLVAKAKELSIHKDFLRRNVNDGFSGGEKKKLEMLQALVLEPKFAIFDEIDTGLDIDALRIVAQGIKKLKEKGTGILIITHYQRILKYIEPDFIHILINGKIVRSGGAKLAEKLEREGYENIKSH